VLKAISDLARAHRLSVVVEGIEQPSALEAVMALGCDYAQGYHLGRPMPADQAFELLAGPVPDTTAIA
jgi:EAL domain-containing protein (putative c-di-GMP-specific phosphodiesterase class I)